jgi:hypothetical protein
MIYSSALSVRVTDHPCTVFDSERILDRLYLPRCFAFSKYGSSDTKAKFPDHNYRRTIQRFIATDSERCRERISRKLITALGQEQLS